MSIEWFRDLVIVIFGLGAVVVVLLLGILALMMYLRVRPIIDSVRKTAKAVEDISTTVEEEIAKPLAQMAAFVQGIRQAISMVSRFRRNKEDD